MGPGEPRPRDQELPELGAALVSLPPGMGVVGTCSRPGTWTRPAVAATVDEAGDRSQLSLKVPVDPRLPPAHCRRLGWRCERVRGFSVVVPLPPVTPGEPPP